MIRNYFKIAIRNLFRNKAFSIINISGLAIGMASSLLILLWVQNELSYDSFYPKSDRIFMAWNRDQGNNGINCLNITPKILGLTLKHDYPEVEKATRVNWDEVILLRVGDKKINKTCAMVDPDFLSIFDFPLLKGNINTALDRPGNIVITEKLSKALFGNDDAMNKQVIVDNKYNFVVTAVMRDLPNNTQFDFDYLLPWSFMHTRNEDDSSWGHTSTHNFVLLKQGTSLSNFNKKIANIIRDHGERSWTVKSFLYPFSKLRLYGNFENGVPAGGRIETVRVFLLIAFFILLIACINFMNMSTARSEKRAREVGIRKVVGAQRKSLIAQFIGESILIAFIAGVISLVVMEICLPGFNNLTGKRLAVDYHDPLFLLLFFIFILFTGLIAGSYPAFFLSSFRPVSVLKGSFKRTHAPLNPRKILVVLQFTCAIILIVCTLIIEKQIEYARNRESGYDKNNIVYSFLSGEIAKNYELIKQDLLNKGIAVSVTKSSAPLTEGWSYGTADWTGKNPNDRTEFNFFNTDGNIVKTAGLQLLTGRDIDLKAYPTDSTAVLLNEAAIKVMGFKNPIGQIIDRGSWNTDWHVVGVIKDFIIQSPYEPIKPMIIQGPKADWFNLMHVKFNHAHPISENIAGMEKIFRQYNPNYPFEYHFIDEAYAKKFSDEQTTGKLTFFFAGLTIFISCLGLFGLAAYMAENRIKEIGVRKVLGASVSGIATLLSKDFLILVFIAILMGSPVAWWSMNRWLAGYQYHISVSWEIFAVAGLLAMSIALITVSFQSIRAALANPIKSLRTE